MDEIIHEVLWADSAKISFSHIIAYLQKEWTEKEVAKFVKHTAEVMLC